MSALASLFTLILALVVGALLLAAVIYVLVTVFGVAWKITANLFIFFGREISDAVRLVGSIVLVPIFALFVVLNVVIGRWSASSHYGRSFSGEFTNIGRGLWRLIIGNPARLLGLGGALEGVEQRLPQAIAEAPGRDKPRRRAGMFDGYNIIGSLPGGGSGGKLYVAEPDDIKRAALTKRGIGPVDRVVIKVFSQKEGSTLDQIVRESRALEAARDLGLVLEHSSEPERFYYVMRYVPGDSLGKMTQKMHAAGPSDGLDQQALADTMGYITDLLRSLHTYHAGGLWHKDVKPENIIIDANDGRAHLVDFGLITPMRSAMTLTTHGTEYFRDPELVRQALRGVKVHQIDGAKFDVYSAGAVLFSVLENSFPAHGGLSQLKKRCPDALRWVTRRAMAEYENRYPTAAAMLADLEAVRSAADPFKLKPADLPSMKGESPVVDLPEPERHAGPEPVFARVQGSMAGPAAAAAVAAATAFDAKCPKLGLKNWWSGKYTVESGSDENGPFVQVNRGARRGTPVPPVAPVPPSMRAPAREQLKNARGRAHARRQRAMKRIDKRRAHMAGQRNHASGVNRGMVGALFVGLMLLGAMIFAGFVVGSAVKNQDRAAVAWSVSPEAPEAPQPPQFPQGFGPEFDLSDLPELTGTLLVVSDLRPPIDETLLGSLRDGLEMVEQAGVSLMGEFVDTDAWDEDELELIGRVHQTIAGLPFDSADLGNELMHMIHEVDEINAILWLGPDGSDADRIGLMLVGNQFSLQTNREVDEVDNWLYEAVQMLEGE